MCVVSGSGGREKVWSVLEAPKSRRLKANFSKKSAAVLKPNAIENPCHAHTKSERIVPRGTTPRVLDILPVAKGGSQGRGERQVPLGVFASWQKNLTCLLGFVCSLGLRSPAAFYSSLPTPTTGHHNPVWGCAATEAIVLQLLEDCGAGTAPHKQVVLRRSACGLHNRRQCRALHGAICWWRFSSGSAVCCNSTQCR